MKDHGRLLGWWSIQDAFRHAITHNLECRNGICEHSVVGCGKLHLLLPYMKAMRCFLKRGFISLSLMAHTLVIARYMEDVSLWLTFSVRSIFQRVVIYDKGGQRPPLGKTQEEWEQWLTELKLQVIRLPNIGRESHTYLTHVIEEHTNGTRQNGCTFFCQGDPRDHIHMDIGLFFSNAIANAMETGFSDWCTVNCHDGPVNTFRLLEWPKGTPLLPNRYGLSYGQWFERFLHRPLPPRSEWRWVIGGIFAIHNGCMYSKPLNFYMELMDEISHGNHVAPEVGHFFERSWRYIFSG